MKRMLLIAGLGIVLGGSWAFLGSGHAADPQTKDDTRDISSPLVVTPHENDRRIARWLAIDNRIVLECAQLAKDRGVSSEIKSLAEKLEAAHQKCADDLNAIVTSPRRDESGVTRTDGETDQLNADGTPKLQDRTPNRERTATLIQDAGTSRDDRLVYQPTDFLAIKESVAGDLKDIARKEWEGVSGEAFDRAFVKHQLFAHEMLLSTIKAVRSNASSEFQKALDKESSEISAHLKTLRGLNDKSGNRSEVTDSEEN